MECKPVAEKSESSEPTCTQRKTFFAKFAGGVARSSFLCLLLSLFLSYSTLWHFCPWRELAGLDIPGWIIEFAGHSADFATVEPRRDVAIFGSSLIAAVSSRLSSSSKLAPLEGASTDVSARFTLNLEQAFGTRIGSPVTLAMAAVPGSMVSDQYYLLKEAVSQNRAPALVILTLAPRDFIDNDVGLKLEETPLRRVLSFLSSNRHFLPPCLSAEGWQKCIDSHRRFFALMQKRLRRGAVSWSCTLLNREESLWFAQQKMLSKAASKSNTGTSETVPNSKPNMDEQEKILVDDLNLYRRRYLPINRELLSLQMNHLEELLILASKENIGVVVFFMPLSRANREMLPDEWLKQFSYHCKQKVNSFGFDIYDLNEIGYQATFDRSDFVDSVHLSVSGAEKFYDIFVQKLLESSTVSKSLKSDKSYQTDRPPSMTRL